MVDVFPARVFFAFGSRLRGISAMDVRGSAYGGLKLVFGHLHGFGHVSKVAVASPEW